MCFSVNVNLVKEELESRYGATLIDPDKYRPSYYYHAFAIPEMPVVCSADRSRINLYKWGLIPANTRDLSQAEEIRQKTFNARAESLDAKNSFSNSFKSRRCIVPVKGFFEWQHIENKKIPWYIYHSNDEIISLAGLYDQWIESSTGEVYNTFTIITTEANELLSEIHNSTKRMPAILGSAEEKIWLDNNTSANDLKDMLRPASDEILKAHTIGKLVNNKLADKNTPDVIREQSYYTQSKLF
jgi:putative SOS response-associated peptidase YedK